MWELDCVEWMWGSEMHGLLRRDAKNRKMILCYTLSPLSAQNLFFCGFHLDGLFNVQCCNPPPALPAPDPPLPPPLTMKLKKENICWWKCIWKKGETNKMGGKKKKKEDFLHVLVPLLHILSLGHSINLLIVFFFFMSPLPHITLTIEMAPMHDHWNLCKFYIKFG